ncbi:MAG: hypothetical protein IPJ08_21290 [Burkholderiales bacterium]|nr:hypothetical protein [Burkholderiales bacterium]
MTPLLKKSNGLSRRSVLTTGLLLVGCGGGHDDGTLQPTEVWPAYFPDASWASLASESAASYNSAGYTYGPNLQDYSTLGDYVNLGLTDQWRETANIRFDPQGVPMVKYGAEFFYNPVTTAEFALSHHGKYLRGLEPELTKFWAGVNRLDQILESDGALRYMFAWSYYLTGKSYQPGWVSGMAQGLALSVYARAWLLSKNPKYLDAGRLVLNFMLKPVSLGGTTSDLRDLHPSLSQSIIYDEYPWQPSGLTLNGFMFSMLGVYDWMQMPLSDGIAAASFSKAMHTLRNILPYYDIGGFSAYDLGHITYKPVLPHIGLSYHAVHVYLLHALHSVSSDPVLKQFELRFAGQVAN